MLLAIRSKSVSKSGRTIFVLAGFVLVGLVTIAYMLSSMVEETTLFPFAVTVLLLWLVTTAAAGLVTLTRYHYRREIQLAQVEVAQSRSELHLIQSQLSPHFLFNTLNNIYGLSLTEPERVPALMLKLSELLRYSIYVVKDSFVPLQNEVAYLRNYLEFEHLRLGKKLDLQVDFNEEFDEKYTIPPLMLVVFVENAFKHSRTTGPIHIGIALHRKGNKIIFSVQNSYAAKPIDRQIPEKHSGFGLDSARKRLDLLYPGRHMLAIDQTDNKFSVHLEIVYQ